MSQLDTPVTFTWNRNYDDLEQVAEWLPAFTVIRDEITTAGGYPYNDDFKGKIPGIIGDREDTAIYLLQGLYRQRRMQERIDGWLAEGFRAIDSVPAVSKFSRVILYRSDRSGEWQEYQDARLVPETKPHQAEVTGKISALLPKGKRSHGVSVGANSYAVLVKDLARGRDYLTSHDRGAGGIVEGEPPASPPRVPLHCA